MVFACMVYGVCVYGVMVYGVTGNVARFNRCIWLLGKISKKYQSESLSGNLPKLESHFLKSESSELLSLFK